MRVLPGALAALALLPASASAHAVLRSTLPERGAVLRAAPAEVELRFSEPVEAEFGAIRVYDARGRQVQEGQTFHPGGSGGVVAVRLKPGLPEGGYTATYRVISADSHPLSSGFVFSVGEGGAAGAASVEDLLEGTSAGPVTSAALGTARALQYGAIALGIGGLIFLLLAWRPALAAGSGDGSWTAAAGAFESRIRTLLLATATVGVASAAAGIVLQGATAAGTSAWSAAGSDVIGDVLGTRFGLVWALGAGAWLLAAALAASGRTRLLALPLLALAALPALGGHASVQAPRALLLPVNALHVIAMAAWLGGIAVLVLVLRSATSALAPGDRVRLLAGSVGRFSGLAGAAVAAIAVTGVIQSIVYLGSFGQLLDTPFGRSVLIKSGLFVAIIGFGYVNRNRLLPRLRAAAAGGEPAGRTGVVLRRTLRLELAIGVAVIAVTGALAGYAPSAAETPGPFSTSTAIGPARLEVTVDPARVGPNEMHVYLFDRRTGAQYDEVEELTVTASLPDKQIGDLALQPSKAGPGHFTITGASFGVAGRWRVEIGARVSEFDLHTGAFELPVQ